LISIAFPAVGPVDKSWCVEVAVHFTSSGPERPLYVRTIQEIDGHWSRDTFIITKWMGQRGKESAPHITKQAFDH
jgi:hypothetical protein